MEELDLKELAKTFWDKKIPIIIIIVLTSIVGMTYFKFFVDPMYSSSTTLVLASSRNNSSASENYITTNDITLNSKLVSTYSELIKSKNILGTVISNLNIDIDEEVLRKNVKVDAVKDTELIKITVTTVDKEKSAQIANEIAKVFMKMVKQIYNIENVQVVDEAQPISTPSNINTKRNLIISIGIGIIISIAYVLIGNMLDTTVKLEEDIERELNLQVLAGIPIYEENSVEDKRGGRRK